MFISLNEEAFICNFNAHPFLKITGPDETYQVELREYFPNDSCSRLVEKTDVSGNNEDGKIVFSIPIEFYGDWEISLIKKIKNYGPTKIWVHRFCDYGKYVLFNLNPEDKHECITWVERISEYQKKHGCKIVINSPYDDINKSFSSYYLLTAIDYYKTYNIGRFDREVNPSLLRLPYENDLFVLNNWKKFWSFNHPRNWENLTSREIIDDILGLNV